MKLLCFLLCVHGHPADFNGEPGAPHEYGDPTLRVPSEWDPSTETSTTFEEPDGTSVGVGEFVTPTSEFTSGNSSIILNHEPERLITTPISNLPPPTLKNNLSYLTASESHDATKLPKTRHNDLIHNINNNK